MPTVKSCCCGCTLRTGTLILLWLSAVFSALNILTIVKDGAQRNIPLSSLLIPVLVTIIITAICVMGIYGVEKERPSYLKPYLGLQVCGLVLIIVMMVIFAIFGTVALAYLLGTSNDKGNAAIGIILVEIICLPILGLAYYFFIVVLSFYKELKGGIPR